MQGEDEPNDAKNAVISIVSISLSLHKKQGAVLS
jgi:hypothetical protein